MGNECMNRYCVSSPINLVGGGYKYFVFEHGNTKYIGDNDTWTQLLGKKPINHVSSQSF